MNHNDHVNLLRPANLKPSGSWADLGAGSGAFTLALRELVGPTANIYAVDKDQRSLNELQKSHLALFKTTSNLHLVHADFSRSFELPALDGIIMANSLHYFKDKEKILRHIQTFLKPEGILLLVEYNVDSGNPWVPYPLSYTSFRTLASRVGFIEPRLLGTHPSRFLHEFYSAMTLLNTKDSKEH